MKTMKETVAKVMDQITENVSSPTTPKASEDKQSYLCHHCLESRYLAHWEWLQALTRGCCNTCYNRRLLEDRWMQWKYLCPAEYQNCDPAKLPLPERLKQVLAWEFGPRGLLLHGPTSQGKTRCAWALLRQEFVDHQHQVVAATGYDFSIHIPALYAQGADHVERWVDNCCRAEICFLDDPFKAKATERTEDVLFAIVDQRLAHQRPLIITANDTGETLAGRLSADRGLPLVRRLRDACTSVAFNP